MCTEVRKSLLQHLNASISALYANFQLNKFVVAHLGVGRRRRRRRRSSQFDIKIEMQFRCLWITLT